MVYCVVAAAAGVTVQLTTLLGVLTASATVCPTDACVVEAVTVVASSAVLDLEQEKKILATIAADKMVLFMLIFFVVRK